LAPDRKAQASAAYVVNLLPSCGECVGIPYHWRRRSGLAISHGLGQRGLAHLLLERHRIDERWRRTCRHPPHDAVRPVFSPVRTAVQNEIFVSVGLTKTRLISPAISPRLFQIWDIGVKGRHMLPAFKRKKAAGM
jgi:hypothetical protein